MKGLPGNNLGRELTARTRGTLASLGCVSLFINVLMLTIPLYMLQLFSRVLVSESIDTLVHLTVLAVTFLAVQAVLEGLRSLTLVRLGAWLEDWLGACVLASSLERAAAAGGEGSQGMRDVAELRRLTTDPGLVALFDLPWVPVYLALMVVLHPLLGMIGIAGAFALLVIALSGEWLGTADRRSASHLWLRAMRLADSLLANSDTISPRGGTSRALATWRHAGDSARTRQCNVASRSAVLLGVSRFIRYSLQIAVFGGGAYLVVERELSAGEMVAAAIVLSRALQPLEVTLGSWRNLSSARLAYLRIRELIEQTPPQASGASRFVPGGPLTGERVTFHPPGAAAPVLAQVSFSVDAAEVLAIIGPSASGKSTLSKLIVGALRPHSGMLRLGGNDIHASNGAERGSHVGYLPQSVRFFDGTVEDNIAMFGSGDDDAVVDAARNAGAHELILSLPDGYRTILGSEGLALSGGQAQRIGLARALYGDPCLVVLDEPNTGLDGEGEVLLARAIVQAQERSAIVILVSHRPNLVALATRVLLLRDGRAEAFGTKDEVLPPLLAKGRAMGANVVPHGESQAPAVT